METKTPAILLKKQHIFVIISIIGIILILGGYSYYSYKAKSIRESKHNELRSIGALKIDQITQWQKERIADARNISQSPFFIRGLEAWLNKENDQSLSTDLLERLTLAKTHFDYKNIFIVSPDGEVLLSIEAAEKNLSGETISKIIGANRSKEITFTDFYFCPVHDKIHYDVIVPIIDRNDVSIAALILRVDPHDYLYQLIQSWPTPSKSSETLLVRKDGDNVLFLNELRHQKNTALKLSFPLTRIDMPAVQAVLGYKGIFEGKDYRGIDVSADIEPVAGTSWFMVAKTDKNEIYSELYFRAKLLFVLTSLLILCFGVALFWIYHYLQRNIYVELLQKERKLSEYN